jgi:transcriptional regulator with XRE-family HTH domain
MGTNPVQRDATAKAVSANVYRLRKAQNLGLRGLATKLAEVGRPLLYSAVDQIEKGTRRVDVDDLVALAAAFGVPPATLLMPVVDSPQDHVELTDAEPTTVPKPLTAEPLWGWLTAKYPLGDESRLTFAGRSWPIWEQQNLTDELAAARKRIDDQLHGRVSNGDD